MCLCACHLVPRSDGSFDHRHPRGMVTYYPQVEIIKRSKRIAQWSDYMQVCNVLKGGVFVFTAGIVNAKTAYEIAQLKVLITFIPNPDVATTSILLEQLHTVLSPDPTDTTVYDLDRTELGHLLQQTTGADGSAVGYVIDHTPREIRLNPQAATHYAAQSLHYYMHTGASIDQNKEGWVRDGQVQAAVLYDEPGDFKAQKYRFLTAAYDRTNERYLGQVTWEFEIVKPPDGTASINITQNNVVIEEITDTYQRTAAEARAHFYDYWGCQWDSKYGKPLFNAHMTAMYGKALQDVRAQMDVFRELVIPASSTSPNTYPSTRLTRLICISYYQSLSATWTQAINNGEPIDTTDTQKQLATAIATSQAVHAKYQQLQQALNDDADQHKQETIRVLLKNLDTADSPDTLQTAEVAILEYT